MAERIDQVGVRIAWREASEQSESDVVFAYRLSRDSALVGETPVGTHSLEDGKLLPNTPDADPLRAVDFHGNESAGAHLQVTTPKVFD